VFARDYNHADGQRPLPLVGDRTVLRPGRDEPYLCIQDIVVFVRDLEVSKRFYVDNWASNCSQNSPSHRVRWMKCASRRPAPILRWLSQARHPEYKLMAATAGFLFMTEDVQATYKEWSERGVRFLFAPEDAGVGRDLYTLRRSGRECVWTGRVR